MTAWFSSWCVEPVEDVPSSELLGVRLWKCGSMAEGSADSPTLSSCAHTLPTNRRPASR